MERCADHLSDASHGYGGPVKTHEDVKGPVLNQYGT